MHRRSFLCNAGYLHWVTGRRPLGHSQFVLRGPAARQPARGRVHRRLPHVYVWVAGRWEHVHDAPGPRSPPFQRTVRHGPPPHRQVKCFFFLSPNTFVPSTCTNGNIFSPDSDVFVTGGDDRTVRVWRISTLSVLHCRQLPSMCRAVCWSPDGAWLAAGMVSVLPSCHPILLFYLKDTQTD